jgi:hypothetical protein
LAKLRGRAAHDPPKGAIEVRHGLKSAGEGSFADARIGVEQQRLRFLHSDSREIVDEIHSRRSFEHLAKVTPADISRLGYSPERKRLGLMLLDELPRSGHIGGLVLFVP